MNSPRRFEAALLVILVIGSGLAGYWAYSTRIHPPVATVFYHFDYQYRAGYSVVEEHTISESMYHILGVFYKHPTMHLTIEIESFVIEIAYYNYSEVYDMIKTMVDRGQLEICLIEYSEMLGHAYPFADYNHSAYYSELIGEQYNITHGKSVLLQEGQWYPGFGALKSYGYTNFMADVAKFLYFGYTPDAPVYSWDLNSFSKLIPGAQCPTLSPDPIYVVNYKHIPVVEAGVNHIWLWTQDAEIQLSAEGNSLEDEFVVDHAKVDAFEARLIELEKKGTRFMTVDEWVQHCIQANAVEDLNWYMPETHWYPGDYRSAWRWMGDNQGHTDDGTMLSMLYRNRNRILAVESLFANTSIYLMEQERNQCRFDLDRAWQNNLLAQGTDVLGLQPRNYERTYGENHTKDAIGYLNSALAILKAHNPYFTTRDMITVDTATGVIFSEENSPKVQILTSNQSLSALPINVTISCQAPTILKNYSAQYCEYRGIRYWDLQIGLNGTGNWEKAGGRAKIMFEWSAKQIQYSPSLMECTLINLTRSDYLATNDIFLPLANGLIVGDGRAMVKNCSRYHTAVLWTENQLGFEEADLHFFANYQLFILDEGYSLDQCLEFANRVNTTPIVPLVEVLPWNQ